MTALVSKDVYDSPSARFVLIPQGSRVVGDYNSEIVHGESRVLVAWTRLILPNGVSYSLGRMPGTDAVGAAGLKGRVNNHYLRIFGSALLLSAITAGAQLSQPQAAIDPQHGLNASQVAAGALGQDLSQVSSSVIRRELDVPPTVHVAPGTQFNIAVTQDMAFPAPYRRP